MHKDAKSLISKLLEPELGRRLSSAGVIKASKQKLVTTSKVVMEDAKDYIKMKKIKKAQHGAKVAKVNRNSNVANFFEEMFEWRGMLGRGGKQIRYMTLFNLSNTHLY
jgi:hypothetical protein